MNILLINHYGGSPKHGMEYRSHYLAREWVKLGHAATVVAASRSHLRVQQPNFAGAAMEEEIDGVRYIWLRTPDYRGNGFRRVLNMFAFVAQLRRFRKRLAEQCRPDAVIAASTYRFEAYSAQAIARRRRVPYIYEVRDLWPLSLIELDGISPWHPFIMLIQRAENFAYRTADHVVATLPAVEEHLRRHGLREGRFTYIPNGIDVQQWQSQQSPLSAEHARAIEDLRGQGRFLVGYAGGHGRSNNLDALIDAAAILKEQPVGFVLVGQGSKKKGLQEKAKQLGLAAAFLPSVPRDVVPALLSAMDALYLGWSRRPVYRFGISPNKLVDYMMAGKPVIHGTEAPNDPVAECGCGESCARTTPRRWPAR